MRWHVTTYGLETAGNGWDTRGNEPETAVIGWDTRADGWEPVTSVGMLQHTDQKP
jgi:hypothetical protein